MPGENLQKQVWTGNQMHIWRGDWESNSGPLVNSAGGEPLRYLLPHKMCPQDGDRGKKADGLFSSQMLSDICDKCAIYSEFSVVFGNDTHYRNTANQYVMCDGKPTTW